MHSSAYISHSAQLLLIENLFQKRNVSTKTSDTQEVDNGAAPLSTGIKYCHPETSHKVPWLQKPLVDTTDVYATTTTPGLLFYIPAQCKQS